MTRTDHELPTIPRRGRAEISQDVEERQPQARASCAPFAGRLALRVPEAAIAIGVGKSTLYTLIAEKKLQTALIAGRRVVPVSELERLLRESIMT